MMNSVVLSASAALLLAAAPAPVVEGPLVGDFDCTAKSAGVLARDVPREALKPRAWDLPPHLAPFRVRVTSVARGLGMQDACRAFARDYAARDPKSNDGSDYRAKGSFASVDNDVFGYECLAQYEAQIPSLSDYNTKIEYRSFYKYGPFNTSSHSRFSGTIVDAFEFSPFFPGGFLWHVNYAGNYLTIEGSCKKVG